MKVKTLKTVDLFGGMDASIPKKAKQKQEIKSTSIKKESTIKNHDVKREIKKEHPFYKKEKSLKHEDLSEKIKKAKK